MKSKNMFFMLKVRAILLLAIVSHLIHSYFARSLFDDHLEMK